MRKFFKAFHYALSGIFHALKQERNFKVHVFAVFVVSIAGWLTRISQTEWLIILVLFGGMLSLELLNSAIERVVDLITKELHPLAKQAKDLAAGAVLLFAIVSALIGLVIFIPKWFY